MRNKRRIINLFIVGVFLVIASCEDFVEVETPTYKLNNTEIYNNEQTAENVLTGIFNQLFNTNFINGGNQSATFVGGLSGDNFSVVTTTQEVVEYYQNQIVPTNSYNQTLWASAYNLIYMVNAMLEGIENNSSLSQELIKEMEGSGKFIRAFTYFYLVNLFGDIPLTLTTDYEENALASRTSSDIIYEQILTDLENASNLLGNSYPDNDRTQLNQFSIIALLSRVHLYLGNWEDAEDYSSQVIEASQYYELLPELNDIFLANSREAIWQISPIGWGNSFTHTREGNLFIKNETANTPVVLSENFLETFDDKDKRSQEWVETFIAEEDTVYFPYKYKIQYEATTDEYTEYSMVFRLAEQYLIRAEANIKLGEFSKAVEDLNKIKSRAEIPLLAESEQVLTEEELLDIILLERRRELFAEWGHRWFDLKRLGKSEILANKENSNWSTTSLLLPIPSSERMKNPNLGQNPGY